MYGIRKRRHPKRVGADVALHQKIQTFLFSLETESHVTSPRILDRNSKYAFSGGATGGAKPVTGVNPGICARAGREIPPSLKPIIYGGQGGEIWFDRRHRRIQPQLVIS